MTTVAVAGRQDPTGYMKDCRFQGEGHRRTTIPQVAQNNVHAHTGIYPSTPYSTQDTPIAQRDTTPPNSVRTPPIKRIFRSLTCTQTAKVPSDRELVKRTNKVPHPATTVFSKAEKVMMGVPYLGVGIRRKYDIGTNLDADTEHSRSLSPTSFPWSTART